MPSCILAVVFCLAGVMTVIAQQKPDFSGEWTLNRQASALSPIVAPVAQSGVLRIEHHEPKFTAHQTIVLDGKPFESHFELLSDGREVVADAGGRRIVSTLRWDGGALLFTSRIQGPNGELTISFRYELQDGGRRLQATEQVRGGGRDQDNLWVFERPGSTCSLGAGTSTSFHWAGFLSACPCSLCSPHSVCSVGAFSEIQTGGMGIERVRKV